MSYSELRKSALASLVRRQNQNPLSQNHTIFHVHWQDRGEFFSNIFIISIITLVVKFFFSLTIYRHGCSKRIMIIFVYHSCINGLVKCDHDVIVNVLAKYDKARWKECLPLALRADRISNVMSSTRNLQPIQHKFLNRGVYFNHNRGRNLSDVFIAMLYNYFACIILPNF